MKSISNFTFLLIAGLVLLASLVVPNFSAKLENALGITNVSNASPNSIALGENGSGGWRTK